MEETSEIFNEFLREDILMTKKALAVVLKNIDITLYIIGAGPVSGPPREYSIVKANYFYSKVGKDVKE